ncbi:MAG: hypothetical protein R6V06_10340 [Kiritimatiellia bacterium]
MDQKIYAVLTGDIVKSRNLSAGQLRNLQVRLKSASIDFEQVFPGSVVGNLGITRGDGWQVALQKPEYALRLALYIRAVVKSVFKTDTCVSIGIGPAELVKDNIIESTGLAFERSGLGLESLKNKIIRMAYHSHKITGRLESAESLLVSWLDLLITPASEKQASLLKEVLIKLKQEEVAEKKGVVQSTVSEGLKAVGWHEMKRILNHFEKYR